MREEILERVVIADNADEPWFERARAPIEALRNLRTREEKRERFHCALCLVRVLGIQTRP